MGKRDEREEKKRRGKSEGEGEKEWLDIWMLQKERNHEKTHTRKERT